jgi:predicted transposase YbfD/YdcC
MIKKKTVWERIKMTKDLISYFSIIKDPRIGNHTRHKLIDIIVIAVLGTICGADTWIEMEKYGKAKEKWLSTFLELPNGIPSHDTFGRVFSLLCPSVFEQCFMAWVQDIRRLIHGEVIAIDGKTVRRSHDRTHGLKPIHLVSAWASENGLVLGQQRTEEKSNEITAIPQLLELLIVKGGIVTIDAMGCQKEIAKKILDESADYVLAVKGNQKTLHEDIQLFFDDARKSNFEGVDHSFYKTVEKSGGRIETRRYWTTPSIDWLDSKEDWAGLTQIGMVESERHQGDRVSIEQRYYITSLSGSVEEFAQAVRAHWTIENSLHWVLDVAFREDDQRMRVGYSAQNAAILRRLALNLLKQEKSSKCGIKAKRLKAGWDSSYLEKVLSISSAAHTSS